MAITSQRTPFNVITHPERGWKSVTETLSYHVWAPQFQNMYPIIPPPPPLPERFRQLKEAPNISTRETKYTIITHILLEPQLPTREEFNRVKPNHRTAILE